MQEPSHVVLSGATGFLGSHVLKALLSRGYEVTIIKRSTSNTRRIENELDRVRAIDADTVPIEAAFSGKHVDSVVHTACSYGRHGESYAEIVETNLQFSLRLLEAAVAASAGKFLNTDTLLPREVSPYSLSKKQFVDWLRLNQSHIQIANLRLEHMYGPGDDTTKFVPWIIDMLLSDSHEILLTPGAQKRDFVHVRDVVMAILRVNELPVQLGISEFDVGSGELVTIRDLVAMLAEIVREVTHRDRLPEPRFGAVSYRPGEIMVPEIDLSSIGAIGWNAQISVYEGLHEMVRTMYRERMDA